MSIPKFIGYCEALPIKSGQIVTIKEGTMVRKGSVVVPAGRTYKVKVDHVLPGRSQHKYGPNFEDQRTHIDNPSVRWSGAHGWHEADINDIPEAF